MVYNWWRRRGGHCLLCNDTGMADMDLCAACFATFIANRPACGHCALPLPDSRAPLCGRCLSRPPPWEGLHAPWRYAEPVSRLIQQLKFDARLPVGRLLGQLLAQDLPATDVELLLPVPQHPRSLRRRGFNHAAEITRSLAATLALPWSARRLLKVQATAAQHGLNRRARLKNLAGAFVWEGPPPPRTVAVIDDVVTTGATAEAVTRALHRAGAEKVWIWAVARTPSGAPPHPTRSLDPRLG